MRNLGKLIGLAALLAAGNALGNGGGHGHGHGDDRPRPMEISRVFARTEIAAPSFTVLETCQGPDGPYQLIHVTGEGPITSDDPRLTGTFIVDALILDSTTTGIGVSTDRFKVIDPSTGRLKVKGKAWGTDLAGEPIKSMAIADLADGSRLATNATVYLPQPGTAQPLAIEYGGAGPGNLEDRAFVISGDCRRTLEKLGFE